MMSKTKQNHIAYANGRSSDKSEQRRGFNATSVERTKQYSIQRQYKTSLFKRTYLLGKVIFSFSTYIVVSFISVGYI